MLVPRIDHIQEGLARVITQYRGKPKLCKYIAVLLDMVQVLEDAIHVNHEAWLIDNATGTRLEVLGDLVGRPRIGSTDAEYRVYIKAQIRSNRSIGKVKDLIDIADMLIPGYRYTILANNAYVWAPPSSLTPATATAVQAMLQRAAPQGGRVWLIWQASTIKLQFVSAGKCLASTGTQYYATGLDGNWDSAAGSNTAGFFAGSRA